MNKKIVLSVFFLLLSIFLYSQNKSNIKIMSYNMFIGKGMDDIISLERVAEVINKVNPDFIGLQEVDSIAERSGWIDQAKELARLTGMFSVFAPATERSKGLYGIASLSKKKPLSYLNIPLPGAEEPRTFLIVQYDDYILCNVHMSLDAESRKQSVKIINETVEKFDKPTIITGDFNMLPESEEFKLMTENWVLLSEASINTYPSDSPRQTLDYIFGYKNYNYKVTCKVVMYEPIVSDHLPIFIDISL
ncbi:endonuclease/exonuclease/phosphatase family protein [Limibacterium fermenti]|uniref:endonuclease/exonuclease/phosphatase family protein n=1 Tax=Limibacterium fermenti TaxID=3229863 RepID=UPI003A70FACF